MTDIPDDVVERAATEMANAAGAELAFLETAIRYYKPLARAAGRVFVEWERERVKTCLLEHIDGIEREFGVCVRTTNLREAFDVIRAADPLSQGQSENWKGSKMVDWTEEAVREAMLSFGYTDRLQSNHPGLGVQMRAALDAAVKAQKEKSNPDSKIF